jgi:hypothetical protein
MSSSSLAAVTLILISTGVAGFKSGNKESGTGQALESTSFLVENAAPTLTYEVPLCTGIPVPTSKYRDETRPSMSTRSAVADMWSVNQKYHHGPKF